MKKQKGEYWIIKTFLDACRDAEQRYNMAQAELKERDQQENDIRHAFENGTADWTLTQLGKKYKEVRVARRKAKNTIEVLQPLVDFYQREATTFKMLERIQGSMRQTEEKASNRVYANRTRILEKQ